MGMGNFVQVKKYGKEGNASKNHLAHVLRQRSKIKNPNIKIVCGNPDDLFRYPSNRKDAVDYFEVMVYTSPENQEEFQKVLEYLQQKFNRPITAVTHYDESHPHTHFLIPWRWTEGEGKAKSIRLSQGDFLRITDDISKIQNRKVVRGQGRKSLSLAEYMANPEEAKRKIEEMTEWKEETLKALHEILNLYGEIEIVVISDKGKFSVGTFSNVDDIPLKRLYVLNQKGNGIYFQPTLNSKKVLFLDDVPYSELQQFTFIVRTSTGKYQVHHPLPDDFSENIGEIQKAMAWKIGADKGATAERQPRRLPNFFNQKYKDKPKVKLVKNLKASLNLNVIRSILNEYRKLKNQEHQWKTISFRPRKAQKRWKDFAVNPPDESVTDMRYALYLFACGCSDQEVKETLKSESPNLTERKGKYVEDYLNRTIEKAKSYITQNLQVWSEKVKKIVHSEHVSLLWDKLKRKT